jgi:hypothetical protein
MFLQIKYKFKQGKTNVKNVDMSRMQIHHST